MNVRNGQYVLVGKKMCVVTGQDEELGLIFVRNVDTDEAFAVDVEDIEVI